MIYKCKDCASRENCPQDKAQYTALAKVVEAVLKLDREDEFRSWFTLTMKCDYFCPDKTNEERHSCG